jgi:hypothetical protein
MTIEKTIQGAWRLSAIVDNHIVTRVYFGYTKRQALNAFREEMSL